MNERRSKPKILMVDDKPENLYTLGIKQAVTDDVLQFIGEQIVYDDLTLVVLKQK